MARLIASILILLLVVFGLAFAVANSRPVELNYFLGTREVPLAMTLVLALVLGAAIGIVFSLGMMVRLRRETVRLRRQVQLTEQEVVNLRSIPIKDAR